MRVLIEAAPGSQPGRVGDAADHGDSFPIARSIAVISSAGYRQFSDATRYDRPYRSTACIMTIIALL
jgi:hypothetical protein